MILAGLERVVPYPKGSDTGRVAEKLEKRYKIFERFAEAIDSELQEKFIFFLERYLGDFNPQAFQEACRMAEFWLNDRWRTYIELAEHGVKTKASQERGDPAFIDTTFFYRNTLWELRQ